MKDEKGEPTGALKERASGLVRKVIPEPTRAGAARGAARGHAAANRLGVTRVHSAGGDFEHLDLYEELRKRGEMTVRFSVSYFLNPPEITSADIEKIEDARKNLRRRLDRRAASSRRCSTAWSSRTPRPC